MKIATRKALTKVVGKKIATKTVNKVLGATVAGRLLGRMVPYAGWALTGYDVWINRAEVGEGLQSFGSGSGDYLQIQQSTGIVR